MTTDDRLNDREWLVAERESGATLPELAAMLNVPESTLYQRLVQLGVRPDQTDHERLNDRDWLFEQLIVRRRSQRDVALELGCPQSTFNGHVKQLKLRGNGPRDRRLRQLSYVQDLVDRFDGSVARIAAHLNVWPTTVASALRWHGLSGERVALVELTPALLRDLYVQEGLGVLAIAHQTGRPPAAVHLALKSAGIERREAGKPALDSRAVTSVEERYANGERVADLAGEYGVSEKTIRRILTRKFGSLSERRAEKLVEGADSKSIRAAWRDGVAITHIAEQHGVATALVSKLCVNEPRGSKPRAIDADVLRERLAAGDTINSIAKLLDSSWSAVQVEACRLGLMPIPEAWATHPEFNAVLDAYASGQPLRTIVSETGVSKRTVQRWAAAAGVKLGEKSLVHNLRWLRRKYLTERLPVSSIAREAGVSTDVIHAAVKKAGLTRPRSRYAELDDATWLGERYWGDGLSTHAIAKELGCNHTEVLRALQRHGIKTRPRRGAKRTTDRTRDVAA